MTEQDLLKDCLVRLGQSGINYMLVGSMAGNYWGIPRSTHDIDFVIEYEAKDVSRIVKLFEGDFFIQKSRESAKSKFLVSIHSLQLPKISFCTNCVGIRSVPPIGN